MVDGASHRTVPMEDPGESTVLPTVESSVGTLLGTLLIAQPYPPERLE
jgi:hypothetical protein